MTHDKNGIITTLSNHTVDETVEKLKQMMQTRGVSLFALIDHSGEAEKVGMKMPSTKLLIFGSPTVGTPIMLAAPSIALDLPLKILVWEDQGKGLDFLQQFGLLAGTAWRTRVFHARACRSGCIRSRSQRVTTAFRPAAFDAGYDRKLPFSPANLQSRHLARNNASRFDAYAHAGLHKNGTRHAVLRHKQTSGT